MSPRRKIFLVLIWVTVGHFLWLALRDTDWITVRLAFQNLSLGQIALLVTVNVTLVILFGSRWWLILRGFGASISLLQTALYKLAAFSISYFTPGPQFGGEPLQVHLLVSRHPIETATAGASLGLDKMIELLANFAFLLIGIMLIVYSGILPGRPGISGLLIGVLLLAVPIIYLMALMRGRHPLAAMLNEVREADWLGPQIHDALDVILDSEHHMARFCREQSGRLVLALFLSMGFWVGLIAEYALALNFLGGPFSLVEILAIMTAARIAFLLPLPGGLGTLELSQIWMMEALGYPAGLGITISLFIRARDVIFGLLGLAVAGITLRTHSPR